MQVQHNKGIVIPSGFIYGPGEVKRRLSDVFTDLVITTPSTANPQTPETTISLSSQEPGLKPNGVRARRSWSCVFRDLFHDWV